ncbi:MAG: HDOD domain-containing protein [Spirochaetales bacterium]|nr:HDOD domain-containing protein [Spirochaetales bacterium]
MISSPLLARIETSKNLPTLPHILLQLIDTCNRKEKGIKELARLINQDPSLSERVLRLVNSAYYSLKKKVSSIDQALLLLGTDAIKNLAISSSIYQVFNRPRSRSSFDLKLFWWHSLSCGAVSRLIAAKIGYPSPDEAFLSGLLHDIGKILLWVNFEEEYEVILRASAYQSDALLKGERELGLTHSQAGAWLVSRWNLHSFLPDAVLYHHDPLERILHASPLVQIVYSANRLCPMVPQEQGQGQEVQAAAKLLGLKRQELEQLRDKAEAEVRELAGSLDIEISPPLEQELGLSAEDQGKYDQLTDWVRDISLLYSSAEALLRASGAEELLKVARQGLQVLFDPDSVCFFRYEPERLIGVAAGTDDPRDEIRELVIPFREEASLLVRSLSGRVLEDSLARKQGHKLTILDEQLVRFLGGEGFLCLPLSAESEPIGVLVLGVTAAQRSQILGKRKLLGMFANLVSLAMFANLVKEREVQHIREERVSASSLLARRIVHEAHNPLGIINNYLSILATKLVDNEAAQDDLRIVREEIRRVSQIISELSSFSNHGETPREAVDVNSVLSDLVKISQEALWQKSKVRVHLGLEPKLPLFKSDKNRLKQVVINLLRNASEAMPGGGSIHIESALEPGDPQYIEIRVKDEGPGIDPEIQKRLFEPFVSSKGHEGLGLSIAYNIVKDLGGEISYQTGTEGGTTFRIRIPVEPAG